MQDWGRAHFKNTNKVVIQGIRTEESIRRYRVVAMKKEDNFIAKPDKGIYFAYPIYDMDSRDVWRVVKKKKADYNRTYDIFNRTEKYGHLLGQRVCPPYGEEPLRGLHLYAECFPEMWHKMIDRVPGAATAARYGNTEMYSTGYKPDGIEWRDHVKNVIETFSGKDRALVSKAINRELKRHKSLTNDRVPDDSPHPLSGISWSFLCRMATRGDFKGRIAQMTSNEAEKQCQRLGITYEEAKRIYGKTKEAK